MTESMMNDMTFPARRQFRTKFKEWQLHISFDSLPQQQMTLSLKSKKQKQLHFKETYFVDNLPKQIKENYFKEVYDLYLFLDQQNNKGVKIYEFAPENCLLRFAYRIGKKVFSLKLRKFVNGVQQKSEEQGNFRQSQRYSTNRMTIRQNVNKQQITTSEEKQQARPSIEASKVNQSPQISQVKQQPNQQCVQPAQQLHGLLPLKNTEQTLHYPELKPTDQLDQDQELDYFFDLEQEGVQPHFRFTEQVEIDYDTWINTIEDNGSQIFPSKLHNYQVADHSADDQPHPQDLKRKLIHSQIYELNQQESDQQTVRNQNINQTDFKQLAIENVQLKHQMNQLLQKVAQLELQNNSLKQKLQKQQEINQTFQKKSSHPYLSQNTQPTLKILTNHNPIISGPYQPFSQHLNPFSINSSSFEQIKAPFNFTQNTSQSTYSNQSGNSPFIPTIQQNFNKSNTWPSQTTAIKRPCMQSKFYKYLNNSHQRLEICYQEYTQEDFEDNFFPYDWSQVKILNLDGNMLMTQGFDKVIQNLWLNVTEISAGYNVIKDVRNLEKLLNLRKIDLRANPLTEFTKNYLECIKKRTIIEILY